MTETGWLNTHDSLKHVVVDESALFADLYLVDFFPLPFHIVGSSNLSSCKNISVPVSAAEVVPIITTITPYAVFAISLCLFFALFVAL